MYNYNPLWATMAEKSISTYYLIQQGIDARTINNLKHNQSVTVLTIEKLCNILDCNGEDIVEIKPDR
ncbi:helix-turn-helix transcriptional regulator [Lachnoclostridium pacaense]|uniref:helix-turn-helix domain-containing protein n=1 Tax=Enterocloster hominis (ex Hitch et al. 2024) TaxID=1917870 RepID=UPI001D104EE1|nr:helix-turn-helix transcriptional regulator [Lachnoclostridium pacaense]MCC2821039.1 helix-turn-helix transcriptional regulator [Lachnoclostridium pacaense]